MLAGAAQKIAPATIRVRSAPMDEDYTLIDPTLAVGRPADVAAVAPPRSGLGYGGMTPEQRACFLDWLEDPMQPMHASYQELYVAHLEARLFEESPSASHAHGWMTRLEGTPAWRTNEALARAIMLGFFLLKDGAGMANWLTSGEPSSRLFDVGLGWQALLDAPITTGQLGEMIVRWALAANVPPAEMLKSRLDSLTATLGTEPLSYARSLWTDEDLRPMTWRCAHRDLRITIPQPSVRKIIEPALVDVLRIDRVPAGNGQSPEFYAPRQAACTDEPAMVADNYLILEFQQSRSEHFDYVLDIARRMEGFAQLMDEDRHIIYRLAFRKSKLRQFWRIWDYVQSWSSTRIYVEGEELEKWKIWPYSQFLR